MINFTNEPPENITAVLQRLRIYVEKSYTKNDKENIQKIISNCGLSIVKTGDWGSRYGYAEAKGIITISNEKFDLITNTINKNIANLLDTLLQTTECGLEITNIEFLPIDTSQIDVETELNQILVDNQYLMNNLSLSEDLIQKGKVMSETYLYIYFVENSLRLFIENVQQTNSLTFPRDVLNTISKTKTNEQQNKFLPLRGNSDLFYCDFVQLQQIIVHNWEIFKSNFPQQDQHWLRVKIEDMYRVRNLIAHCGYISNDEFEMVKSNFKMILRQLKFTN